MHFLSTRGQASSLGFKDVTLAGLASDRGLYVPEQFPKLSASLAGTYASFAAQVMAPFVGDQVPAFKACVHESYKNFAPVLKQLDTNLYILELFNGPTLAFKDFALQLLGRLFGVITSDPLVVLGATSGDTGSAAMEGCKHAGNAHIYILYPHERPSDVQRRQMTTLNAPNVHALAVQGSFDDCQDMVKAVFNDPYMRRQHRLVAINSINWARIMAQIAYYAFACASLPNRVLNFVVPTGNFGNVYAGYVAQRMGANITGLHIATNENDALHRMFETGRMQAGTVARTVSPSMDIQTPSNFERYLFECMGRDGDKVSALMQHYKQTGDVPLPALGTVFTTTRHDDARTLETMAFVHKKYDELIDPHTAVAMTAALDRQDKVDGAQIVLGCAHPAKFPDAVFKATGIYPALPAHLSDLHQRAEVFSVIPPDVDGLKALLSRV